jgi:hypothetical protein
MGDGVYDELPVPERDKARIRSLPVVYGPAMIDPMGASIDGGWFGAADASEERPERTDTSESDPHAINRDYLQSIEEEQARYDKLLGSLELPPSIDDSTDALEPEEEDVSDLSSGLQVEVHPEDQSPLSESERQSVTDSVKGFAEFARRRLLSLAADHLLPGLGGRLVDWGFEVLDVATSVRALGSDDPVLEAPLPSPVPSLGFTLEIPLTSGEDGQVAPPLALCVAPDSPSLTGGWALDAAEHDHQQAQGPPADVCEAALERFYSQRDPASRPTAAIETSHADQSKPRVRPRSATACLVEIDLDSLRLPRRRKPRAWMFAVLAAEYAARLRENPDLLRFELFIIADKGRRCGLWIWLDADIDIDRLAF